MPGAPGAPGAPGGISHLSTRKVFYFSSRRAVWMSGFCDVVRFDFHIFSEYSSNNNFIIIIIFIFGIIKIIFIQETIIKL